MHFESKAGATYDGCPLCKGIWISLKDMPKVFGTAKVLYKLRQGLTKSMKTKFACPGCTSFLQTGNVGTSDLSLDECPKCQSYFFDDREMRRLYEELQTPELPEVQSTDIDMNKMVQTKSHCPVCKDQHLWSVQGQTDKFSSCLKCGGSATNVESLQKMAGRSIFSPTMFVFRTGQGLLTVCRHCQECQESSNTACRKCGCEILRVQCLGCSDRMSEYILGDLIIERCQMCNTIWLDDNEFEKVMTSMPDVRRHYDEGVRQSELLKTEVLAASHVYRHGIEQGTRKMIDRFWGVAGVFFFDY